MRNPLTALMRGLLARLLSASTFAILTTGPTRGVGSGPPAALAVTPPASVQEPGFVPPAAGIRQGEGPLWAQTHPTREDWRLPAGSPDVSSARTRGDTSPHRRGLGRVSQGWGLGRLAGSTPPPTPLPQAPGGTPPAGVQPPAPLLCLPASWVKVIH